MMKWLKKGDWGIRILALVLAIVIYHVIKKDTSGVNTEKSNDTPIFQYHR